MRVGHNTKYTEMPNALMIQYLDVCGWIRCSHHMILHEPSHKINSLSLASLLWDIGKQHSPRCDAAERGVPSGAILFA